MPCTAVLRVAYAALHGRSPGRTRPTDRVEHWAAPKAVDNLTLIGVSTITIINKLIVTVTRKLS